MIIIIFLYLAWLPLRKKGREQVFSSQERKYNFNDMMIICEFLVWEKEVKGESRKYEEKVGESKKQGSLSFRDFSF